MSANQVQEPAEQDKLNASQTTPGILPVRPSSLPPGGPTATPAPPSPTSGPPPSALSRELDLKAAVFGGDDVDQDAKTQVARIDDLSEYGLSASALPGHAELEEPDAEEDQSQTADIVAPISEAPPDLKVEMDDQPDIDSDDAVDTGPALDEDEGKRPTSILDEELDLPPVDDTGTTDIPLEDQPATALAAKSRLGRPLLSAELRRSAEQSNWPRPVIGLLASLNLIHLIGGAAGLGALIAVVTLLASSGAEEPPPENTTEVTAAVVASTPQAPPVETTDSSGAAPIAAASLPSPAETSTPDAAPPAPAEDTARSCKPLAEYSTIPWQDTLNTLLTRLDQTHLCQAFGASPKEVTAALEGSATYGPTGYDLLEDATVIELFPAETAKRNAPSIELIFIQEKLYKIHLQYGQSQAKTFGREVLEQILGQAEESGTDQLNRTYSTFVDGDLRIRMLERTDRYKRVFQSLFLSDGKFEPDPSEMEERALKAEAAQVLGMDNFNIKDYKEALKHLTWAQKLVPQYGAAYVMAGLIHLRKEAFDEVEAIAEKILRRSTDDRARANAEGLRAVVSMFKGDRTEALGHYQNAKELDPLNEIFANSIKELKSGTYKAAEVAKTAARLSCRTKQGWTSQGLFARGNFPSRKTYLGALRKAKTDKKYKKTLEQWKQWECR